ncbi:hypothetical protein GUITHDRAFT_151517 [Guillardia theta CCMP2712]|uniref:Uncharacterized protein n=1 Tax=Guillardia theta (strain CCMP2712) TaxID=905079 RepID=L1JLV7_GUITC|nr:hypothetical protein GUITHDRAFT_151517 [Guillardia theta CCMP2712]EKX49347.1 hypothetical protein GUITHDRAFT_151517 [Guillardia theta CCMP2712]|eukprot:XP_005836327.1 hypothetical protein GUITHDRAFT_151517 [Guillardia theta CCMP2712]
MLDEQDTPTSPVHAFDVYDAVDFSGSLLVESSEETEDRVDVAAEDDTSTEEFLARGTSIENSRFSSEHDDSDQLTIALVDSVREELDKTGRGSSDSELLLSPMQVRLKCLRPADGIPSTPLTALGLR